MNIKNKKTNRIISFLLVFCMIFSMIPNIFATDTITTVFSVEKTYNDNDNYYHSRPHTTEVSIYGTNTENDTENGTLITTTELTWKTLEDNTRLYSAIVEIDTQDYQYYYVKELIESSYDTEWQTETTVTVLTSDSEEYTNIISGLEIEDTTNVKVVKTSLTSTPVEKTYNYNLVNIWNDDNDSKEERPDSVEIKIWGAPDQYDTEYGKLLDTFTISSENMIDENTWKIENKQTTTAFPYVFAEASYEGAEEGKYSVIVANGLSIENANDTCDLTITNNYGYYYDISITSYWDDEEIDTHRDDITVNIYGVNNYDDYYNKTNGTLIKTVTITAENAETESRWNKHDTLTLDTKYNWAYAKVSSSMYDNEVYAINELDCNIYNYINAPRTISVSFRNDLISKQDVDLTITWDDETADSRPNELTLDIYSASRYNETFSDSITINKNDDLNLDGDENTWELSLKDLNTLVDLDYILIEVNTTDTTAPKYYYSSSRVAKATDGPTAIAMTATFASYPQVMNLIFNWDDNNNEKGERPESISFDIYATNTRYSYSDGDYSAYDGELLETVTMTAADVSPDNSNQWLKTLNYTTGYTTLYVLYSSPNTGSEKYIAQIDSKKITSNNPTTYEITMSSTYGYENDFYINFNWLDNSDAGKVRPDNVKIKIYGTNTEGDTSNGVLLFEDTLNGSDKSLDMIYTSEKYNYYYSEAEIINAETPLGTYTLKDSSYRITEDGVSFTFEISLDREMKLHITKKWEDSTATEGTRPEEITYNIYGREGWNKVLIDTITLTPTDPSANTWEFDTSIYGPYVDLEVEEVFNNKESYLDPVISIERTDSNVVDYDLTTDITADGEIEKEYRVELYINATWEDYENKPEEFSFTLMGTNYLSTYEELSRYGTNIEEYTLTTDDIINSYGNTDTYIITIDSAKYSYYYLYGVTQSSDLIHTIYRQTIMPNTAEHSLDSEVSAQMFVSGAMIEANLEFAKPAEVEYVSFNVESTSTYVERNKVVSFNITKTWDDQNNYFNERPEEITLKLYGTNTKNATSDGELLETITLSANNDLNIDTNDNTWEYKITDLKTTYNYFYMTEEYDDSLIEGTYTLTANTIEEYSETESESLMINTQELLNSIQNEDEYAVSPMSSQTYGFTVTKIWDDNNNANGLRPESIIVNVYGNYVDNEERKELIAKIKLSEEGSELLYSSGMLDTYRYLGDETESTDPNIWNFFSSFTDTSIYVWFEEENVELENEAYYAKDISYTAEGEDVKITIINRYIDHPTYNVQLTNTYAPKQRDVQFKLNKIWNDQNNKYNLRPYEIEFKLYGTNIEGATSGGELLKTITLNSSNAINTNTWSIITEEFETIYDYFYIKETSISGNYTTIISPIEKVDSFTTVINNLQNNSGIAPLSGSEDFIYLYKIWDDNNNEKGKRPESITINAYTDEAKTDLYFSLELTETTCTMLEDPHGIDFYSYGGWSAESIFFGSAPNVPELYIEEICDNYVSSIVVSVENSEEFLGTDTNITITNTYTENPAELYEVNITNTVIEPEIDIQFKIKKIWDDQNNKFNARGPITIGIYGTNTEGATSGGTLIDTITLTEADSISDNEWLKTTSTYLKNYEYFYMIETSNNSNYASTISQVTKNSQGTNIYSNDPEAALALRDYSIIVKNEWEDTDETKRPEFIDFEILYSENTSASISEMELYAKVRVIDNESYIIEDPLGKFTLGRMTKPAWLRDAWAFDLATTDTNYVFAIREISPINYYSEIETEITHDGDWTHSVFTVTNNYYAEEYEATVTNSYSGPVEVIFNINKTWDDGNNTANLRPQGIQVQIYGTNTEGATSGGTLIDTVVLTNENVDSTNSNVWNKTVVLDADYPYFYAVELSSIGTELSTYTLTSNTVTKVDNTIQPANKDVYNINLTNKLDSVPLTITKIWKDDNNMYNTRPDSLNITVYQNGRVFDVITFTSANVIGGNNNVWEAVINVPKLDENGNEYVYSISEDENCLELGYYYYEPYITQTSLTAINVGIWLPPLDIDIVPSYSITVGKEIINVEGQLATEADFWRMYLNKNDTYNFPIVLKQLERIISRGETGMEENYEGYTGIEIHGVLTNKGQIVFTDLEPGKYEISENINQYFDFVSMESILASSGASLTYENGKYYITLSGVTGEHEEITIKVINKLKDERPFNDLEIKENLFKIERDE